MAAALRLVLLIAAADRQERRMEFYCPIDLSLVGDKGNSECTGALAVVLPAGKRFAGIARCVGEKASNASVMMAAWSGRHMIFHP